MSEWLKELASKASMRVTVSEVRILSLPPETKEESLLSCFVSEGSTEDDISSRFRHYFKNTPVRGVFCGGSAPL